MNANPLILADDAPRRLVLVGNPNVGKSVLFGALTGRYVTVANYPGTTVEITRGAATLNGERYDVIDTPGTNGLVPQSEDERVTRDVLIDDPGVTVLQIGDVKNLRRTLLLTSQLTEWGVPFALCLNMIDEARDRGITVDAPELSRILGVPVVQTAAVRRHGVDRLRREISAARTSSFRIRFSSAIEDGIAAIESILPDIPSRRGLAVAALSGDETLVDALSKLVDASVLREVDLIRERTQAAVNEPLAYSISRERLGAVDALLEKVWQAPSERVGGVRAWLGAITMHPVWGIPFLGLVLWFAWWFVGTIGAGAIVDFLETTVFNGLMNPVIIRGLDAITAFPHTHVLAEGVISADYTMTGGALSPLQIAGKFVHDLLVGPYGVITMAITYAIAIVLPVVGTFFIFFGLLEDSGYLPRLAVMLNRIFRAMGLNGKAVLPMVLGLGCDTMATLTTRILETRKERIIVTLLLALAVPCSAQLGVIMAMLGALSFTATLIWLGVIGGTIFLVGWLSSLIVKGEPADFVLELPPIRKPKISNILIKVLARVEWYLKEAVPLFVIGTLVLYTLDLTGLLTAFQRIISPLVVGMLGLPMEAGNAFLIGFLRRDYGAAGLFVMQRDGLLTPLQTLISITVITLFIPCIANFFMMIRERGMKTALLMTAFIIPYAFGTGWLMRVILGGLGLRL